MVVKQAVRPTPTPPGPVARAITARTNSPGLAPRNPPPVAKPNPIKVRATALGYYDHLRRRIGDVFVIANARAFSEKWMERVDGRTPERQTTSAQAMRQKHDEILGGTVTGAQDVFGDQ